MANTTSSIVYGGYVFKVGDTLKVSNNILYPSITASSGNNINMLNQCVMKIVKIYQGSSGGVAVRNPLQLSWVSGPSGSYNGGGYVRLDQISLGSGGTSTIVAGNLALYAFDQRTGGTVDAGGWAESFYIDWNSYKATNGNSISHYEIWYSEAPDAGNKPGTWSGRNWVKRVDSTATSGHVFVGTLDQNRSASDWGGRNYWYRFSVVAIGKNGGYSRTDLFTNWLRKCQVHTYNFNLNGGSGAPTVQYKFSGYNFQMPNKPAKTGYSFINWKYGTGVWNPGQMVGTGSLNSNKLPDSNISSITAQWTANIYTVKFNANGGNCSISSKNVNYNNSIGTLPVAKRTGYIFNGWYTSSSSGLKIDESYLITDNITLYAHWTAKTSSNTFWRNFDRYDNTYMTKNYTYDSYGQYFPDYWTRTGYTFLGWNNDRTAYEAIFSPNESVSNAWIDSSYPSADLFAIWNINQYTLTINPNGGTWDGYYGEESFTQNYNSTIYIQDPIRTGYTFKGWLLSGYGHLSDRTFTFGEGNTTLTAQWEINQYTVKFDANSGLINGTQTSLVKKISHGSSLGTLPIAEKEFYKFIGWFTSPTGGTQINSNTIVTKNITYYAHYESRFYVYTGGKWVKGNLYSCSGGTWKPVIPVVRIENQWK